MLMWIGIVVGVIVLALVGLVIWARVTSPARFPFGTLAFEAELSLPPLLATIEDRRRELTQARGARAAELQDEIAFLVRQAQEIRAVLERGDLSPGRGYVGFDGYGSGESSWVKASRVGARAA
jgi:hypothetical protein